MKANHELQLPLTFPVVDKLAYIIRFKILLCASVFIIHQVQLYREKQVNIA